MHTYIHTYLVVVSYPLSSPPPPPILPRCARTYTHSWPLRCVDFVFAKICVDTDDQSGGGLGALNWGVGDLVQEPIPVRVEDGWLN